MGLKAPLICSTIVKINGAMVIPGRGSQLGGYYQSHHDYYNLADGAL